MTLKYLKKLHPILNKVGKKHGITIEEGEFIISEFFKSFKAAITDPRIPKVKFPSLGNFTPRITYIYRSIKPTIRFHRAGGSTREFVNAKIARIWPIRNRLIEEDKKKITWNTWKKQEKLDEINKLVENERQEREKSKAQIYGGGDNPKESNEILRKTPKGLHRKAKKQKG